jgi:hypothetical protein
MMYLDELAQQLTAVRIGGRLRRRIVGEIADHLACDPEAELGSPRELARSFADELGTSYARRAGFSAFVALAITGTLFAGAFLTARVAGPGFAHTHARSALLGDIAMAMMVLFSQLAFVAGFLAALRAFRHRRERVVSAAEARMIARRTAVALVAGLATMAGLALAALEFQSGVEGWWTTLALCASALGVSVLLAATPSLLASLRVRPTAPGAAGDVFDDLGRLIPTPLRGRPWAFALTVAAALAVCAALAGFMHGDGPDGVMRGVADALACLTGFTVLGRYLGLRHLPER